MSRLAIISGVDYRTVVELLDMMSLHDSLFIHE